MTGPFLRRCALALLVGTCLSAPAGAQDAAKTDAAKPDAAAAQAPAPGAGKAEAATPAASGTPTAADLLFETAQLAATKAGQPLTYLYSRKVSDPELGASFDDTIKLEVEPASPGAPASARTLKVNFFSAERHRAAGPFEDVTGNPVMILFLENHVADLSAKLLGNPRYFKNAIRAAMRDKAEVTPAEFKIGDAAFKGWRVKVMPFTGDANTKRMRGLDTLTYEFDVAPDLPGQLARISITADAKDGRLWEETLTYDPKGS